MHQDTIFNVYSNNEQESFAWAQCSQCGLVEVYQNNMRGSHRDIGTWVNISGFKNYPYHGNVFNDVSYQAIIGSHFDGGVQNYAESAEPVRLFACPGCYIANSDFLNAGSYYAELKVHASGLTSAWIGRYTEYVEISDNFFGGTSGANAVELAPQNSQLDERLRYIVVERNVFNGAAPSGRQLQISGANITARSNAFLMRANTAFGIQVCQRGIEPAPQFIESYNNTFYSLGTSNNAAIEISSKSCGGTIDASSSYFKNNLAYFPAQSRLPVVGNAGSIRLGIGNVVSNNTAIVTDNPSFKDSSGTFLRITDWKPAANFSGAASVPGVLTDAVGVAWPPIWDLGAIHH